VQSSKVLTHQLATTFFSPPPTVMLYIALASAIYRRAIVLTGRRVSLREVITPH
jgi:hypothetical protein